MAERPKTPFDAIVPDIASGLRAAVATIVPFYLASFPGHQALTWTALGGWLGTLADPGGSRASRFKVIVGFAVAGSLALSLAQLSASQAWLATACLAAAVFFGSLLRVFGAAATSIGVMLAIVVAVGGAHTSTSPWRDGLYFLGGAAWATALSTIVWPVWTHLPVRRTIGELFRGMAAYAADLDDCIAERTPHGDPRWSALARTHRHQIRAAIEASRAMAVALRARRQGESRLGGNLRVLLGLGEAQFPLLIALAEDVEALPVDARDGFRHALGVLRDRYAEVHRALVTTVIASPPKRSRTSVLSPRPETPLHPTQSLAERLVDASALSTGLAGALDAPPPHEPIDAAADAEPFAETWSFLRDDLRNFRDALSPKSHYFRHALRVACAAAVASFVGQKLSPDHSAWVTVTTIAVIQPYAGATWTRAAERVVGTVFGSIVAALIGFTLHSPLALVAVMFPLSIAAVATRPRSYRLFTFFLTPVFVLLAERFPGDWWTAAVRAGDALAGGAVALIAALAIFPSWEYRQVPDALAAVLRDVGAYADAVLGMFHEDPRHTEHVANVRRDAGVALGDAETALERMLAEPIPKRESAADSMQLVTYARRLAGALTALETYVHHRDEAATSRRETSPKGLSLDQVPLEELGGYVHRNLAAATTFVREGKRSGPAEAPVRFAGTIDPHLRALLERIVAHAALIGGLVTAPTDERREEKRDGTRGDT